MRQLYPTPVDPVEPYLAYRPDDPHAALLRLDMVASVDGAVTDEAGRTGQLGGPGDLAVFTALRALADAVVVGAGTARTEGYGPHRLRPSLRERREADGRSQPAAVVVVSRSLDLDFDAALFTDAVTPTVVLCCEDSPVPRRRAAEGAGRVIVAGDDTVDLRAGVQRLRSEMGYAHLLCEGGPTLNAALLAADLVDEVCLTVAPALLGDRGPRLAGSLAARRSLRLRAVCEHDGELYLRYSTERDRQGPTGA